MQVGDLVIDIISGEEMVIVVCFPTGQRFILSRTTGVRCTRFKSEIIMKEDNQIKAGEFHWCGYTFLYPDFSLAATIQSYWKGDFCHLGANGCSLGSGVCEQRRCLLNDFDLCGQPNRRAFKAFCAEKGVDLGLHNDDIFGRTSMDYALLWELLMKDIEVPYRTWNSRHWSTFECCGGVAFEEFSESCHEQLS